MTPQDAPQQFGHPSTWPKPDELLPTDPPPQTPPPGARRSRAALWIALSVAAVLVVAGGAMTALGAAGIGPAAGVFKDSGVTACESIRDNTAAKKDPSLKPGSMSGYRAFRKAFHDSRHDDLRSAGTDAMDFINQLTGSGSGDANAAVSLVATGPLIQKWATLSGACANHGVMIPKITDL